MNTLSILAETAGHWGGGFGGGGFWFLFPILWIIVIGTVVWLIARRTRKETPGQRATAILASRYARGEIDVDEYHKRLDGIKDL